MHIIIYAGDEYLTGDEIADALMAYGRALSDEVRAEIVEIPVREPDGSVVSAKFLIGPASQIVAKSVPAQGSELEDDELVARLHRLVRGVESPRSEPLEMPGVPAYELD